MDWQKYLLLKKYLSLQYRIPTTTTWFISASIHNVFDTKTRRATIGDYDISLNDVLKNNCYCSYEFIDANIKLPTPINVQIQCHNIYIDTILEQMFNKSEMEMIYAHDFTDKCVKNVTPLRTTKSHKELVKNIFAIIILFASNVFHNAP
jgi:hypothetical protein